MFTMSLSFLSLHQAEKVDLEPTKSLDNLRRTIQGGSGWLAFGDSNTIYSSELVQTYTSELSMRLHIFSTSTIYSEWVTDIQQWSFL